MKTHKTLLRFFFLICIGLVLNSCLTNPGNIYSLERSGSMAYPDDGKIYNQWLGETVEGYRLADGWRRDSINGGLHKEVYVHPYQINGIYQKDKPGSFLYNLNFQYFYYSKGKAVDGYHQIPVDEESREVFACEFKSGMAHGTAAFFNPNGDTLARGTMEYGEIVGKWVWYYNYPNERKKGIYAKGRGKPVHYTAYDQKGRPIIVCRYKSDRVLEEYKEYSGSTLLVHKTLVQFEGTLERPGDVIFQVKNYHPNGQVASEGKLVSDYTGILERKTGIWKEYDQQGTLIKAEEFEDD